MPLRLRLPFVQIRVVVKVESRDWELSPPRPRFTVRGMMALVLVVVAFLAWVNWWEMHRVRSHQEVASRMTQMAAQHPHAAFLYKQMAQSAASRGRFWAGDWTDWLIIDAVSFCAIGLLLWLSYYAARFVLSPRPRPSRT